MAFNYYTNDSIKLVDVNDIPKAFIAYFEALDDERKNEIKALRPDLVNAILGNTDEEIEEQVEDIEESDSAEDETYNLILDEWESIKIRDWLSGRIRSEVLVCKIVPNGIKKCPVHRKKLSEIQVALEYMGDRGRMQSYHLVGSYCPDCMDLFVEEKKLKGIIRKVDEYGILALIQPLAETQEEWKAQIEPLEISDDTIIYIPSTWNDAEMTCPVHPEISLVEDYYVKKYKNRAVEFEACTCEKCNKLIMRNSKAERLEYDCGEVGVPQINFEPLRKIEPANKRKKTKRIIRPNYFIQGGEITTYNFDEDIEWDHLTEADNLTVSYSPICMEEDHVTEDVVATVSVKEKKGNSVTYLLRLGYCANCEKYFIDKDDYVLLYEKGRPAININDETDSDFYITSGEVYNEEAKKLESLETQLEEEIDGIKNNGSYISPYAVNDFYNDDSDNSYQKACSEKYSKEIQRLASYEDSPYAHRADFTFDGKTKVYYLGPDDIEINGEQIVISYNSDFGQELVNYQTLEMEIDGQIHKAKRRRDFDIAHATLYGFTEQSDEDVIFQSGITDPYLIKVLNSRKKKHQLLDIVSTAQQNQREIINLPLGTNIIVQGCAGSGKTMVLLQRLSSLKYRNKNFDFGDAIILTPNDNFNMHIGGVASSLQIGYIERVSVEGYYLKTLLKYDDSFKPENKIVDEMNVNQDYVDYIYSDEFLEAFTEAYKKKIENIKALYEKLAELSASFGRSVVEVKDGRDADLFTPLIYEIADIQNEIEAKNKTLNDAIKQLEDLNKRKVAFEEKVANSEKSLAQNVVDELLRINTKIKDKISEKKEEIDKINQEIEEFNEDYAQIENGINPINRGRRLAGVKTKISNREDKIKAIKDDIVDLENRMSTDTSGMSRDELKTFIFSLSEVEETALDSYRLIERLEKSLADNQVELETLPTEIEKAQKIIDEEEDKSCSAEVLSNLKVLKEKIKPTSAKEVYDSVYRLAQKNAFTYLYNKTGKDYDENSIRGTHRYDLYLQLQFALMYFKEVVNTNTFICIDEGQDLTVSEYQLIKAVNQVNPIFNIYGDTNQLLKYNRGISDWKKIEDEIRAAEYKELKENYRNTNQITQFCIDNFQLDIRMVGVDGKNVREIDRQSLESKIQELKLGEDRIAVIVPREVRKKDYFEADLLPPKYRDAVDYEGYGNGKISVQYVDEIKGVEFDKVFVIPNGMTKQEKYIAYTRALSELTIVQDYDIDRRIREREARRQKNAENKTVSIGADNNISSKNIMMGKVVKRTKPTDYSSKKTDAVNHTTTENVEEGSAEKSVETKLLPPKEIKELKPIDYQALFDDLLRARSEFEVVGALELQGIGTTTAPTENKNNNLFFELADESRIQIADDVIRFLTSKEISELEYFSDFEFKKIKDGRYRTKRAVVDATHTNLQKILAYFLSYPENYI